MFKYLYDHFMYSFVLGKYLGVELLNQTSFFSCFVKDVYIINSLNIVSSMSSKAVSSCLFWGSKSGTSSLEGPLED